MPCCAFAAFIVGQILIGLDGFKRFILGRSSSEIPVNPPSEWRLGALATLSPVRSRFAFRWLVVAGSLEIVLALSAGYALRNHVLHHGSASTAEYVMCRSSSVAPR